MTGSPRGGAHRASKDSFVDALDRQIPGKSKIKAIIGGSLGGDMSLDGSILRSRGPPHCLFKRLGGRSRERHSPLAAPCPSQGKHIRQQFVRDNPNSSPSQSQPGQANPSPAKPIQIKLLGFAWFYSSESGLINGLQRIPNKNFSPQGEASLTACIANS